MDTSFEKSLARGEPHARRQARERAKKKRDEEYKEFLVTEMQRRRDAFHREMADPRTVNVEKPIFASLPKRPSRQFEFRMYADEVEDTFSVHNLPW